MKKLMILAAVAGMSVMANAGSFLVHIKMPDGSVTTLEFASIPNPDSSGMYRFHRKTDGDLIVHVSNVWIEEKSNKGKNKSK